MAAIELNQTATYQLDHSLLNNIKYRLEVNENSTIYQEDIPDVSLIATKH